MVLGRILIAWLIHAVALLSLPYLMDSIQVDHFYSALLAAILLGLVNALIKPLFVLLTLPITMLTMGMR
jgi:putative membrane protein